MKIDYHVHLEEGPYSFQWLKRTVDAISSFKELTYLKKGSKELVMWQVDVLKDRLVWWMLRGKMARSVFATSERAWFKGSRHCRSFVSFSTN